MKKKRVVYFGSPEFSLPPLKTLYLGGYDIVGVYTQEPKKKFRGQKKYNTPVQQWAESQLLPDTSCEQSVCTALLGISE